jgi:hypothetical protein
MKTALTLCIAMVAAVSAASAQDALTAARDLYAAASYEEALVQLDRASAAAPVGTGTREIEQYRAFCLFALGRTREAEATLEALVRKDPFVALDRRDASPRIESLFTEVRNRLLPELIREEYQTARAQAQQKAPDARTSLERVRGMLELAREIHIWDETLADLQMLVDGFLELQAAGESPARPADASPAVPRVENGNASPTPAAPNAGTPTRTGPAGDEGTNGDRPVGTSGTAVVEPPIVIAQPAPVIPPNLRAFILASKRTGTYEVLITETGTVRDVVIRQSISPAYDRLFIQAARTWKYRPATRDGTPVASAKTITVQTGKE